MSKETKDEVKKNEKVKEDTATNKGLIPSPITGMVKEVRGYTDEYTLAAKLYKKMMNVMENIEYLNKDDTISYGSTHYKAMSEEKVTSKFRVQLIKQGLVVYPTSQTVTTQLMIKKNRSGVDDLSGILTTTNTVYRMADIDTGYSIKVASSGQGVDTQDKGVGKAMTYSFKYLFYRAFALPTGDDPDKISSEELTDIQDKEINKNVKTTDTKKIDTVKDAEEYMKKKFPGTVVKDFDKNKETKSDLANDKDVLAMKQRVLDSGKTNKIIVDALIRSYTFDNKDTLLRILESKI